MKKLQRKKTPSHSSPRDAAHAQWLQHIFPITVIVIQGRIVVNSLQLEQGLVTWPTNLTCVQGQQVNCTCHKVLAAHTPCHGMAW